MLTRTKYLGIALHILILVLLNRVNKHRKKIILVLYARPGLRYRLIFYIQQFLEQCGLEYCGICTSVVFSHSPHTIQILFLEKRFQWCGFTECI